MATYKEDKRKAGRWVVQCCHEGKSTLFGGFTKKQAKDVAETFDENQRLFFSGHQYTVEMLAKASDQKEKLRLLAGLPPKQTKAQRQKTQKERDKTNRKLSELIDLYLKHRKNRIAPTTLKLEFECLNALKVYGGNTSVKETALIDFCRDYQNEILDTVKKGDEYKHDHGHNLLKYFRTMMLWAVKNEEIDFLCEYVRDRFYAKVKGNKPKLKFFKPEEIHLIIRECNPVMRAFVLYTLNTGGNQSAVASVTHDMIDWEAKTLTRYRKKTEKTDDKAIAFVFHLWPETIKAIKEVMTKPGETEEENEEKLVFLNENGKPFVDFEIKTNRDGNVEEVPKLDNIQSAFWRLRKKHDIALSYKFFRKTGANKIKQSDLEERGIAHKLYLSHSVMGIEKDYVDGDFRALWKATKWLRTELDIPTAYKEALKRDKEKKIEHSERAKKAAAKRVAARLAKKQPA